MLNELEKELIRERNPKQGELLQRFFKTGKGEYGEGDVFYGIKVPVLRKISNKYKELELKDIKKLLENKVHEFRLVALFILVSRFEKHPEERKQIFEFYLENTRGINNWDLVDLSALNIVGRYIFNAGKENPILVRRLFKLSESSNIWERRISVLSTFYFIKNNRFDESIAVAKILLKDKHDLIHKAVGWMLREIGKRDEKVLETFLKENHKDMPRTMLRYAIEKFPEEKRKAYLKGEI
jgi:3-methyladenine DNA glycosylase AlkD